MIVLPGLAVIFAGLIGGDGNVGAQLKQVVRDLHVKSVTMQATAVRTLTHHSEATRELVRNLHVDGVIACEVIKGHGQPSLRIVIYEGDGHLKTYSEIPLGPRGLTRSDLAVLLSNLKDDVTAMRASEPEPEPEPAPPPPKAKVRAPEPEPDPTIVIDDDVKAVAPKPPVRSRQQVAADDDDDNPIAPKKKVAPSHAQVAAADEDDNPIAQKTKQTAAPHEDVAAVDDAVSADEIAALTGGDTDSAPAAATAHTLKLGAAAGIGVASRSFSPAPSTVQRYDASPVPSLVLDARVQPTKRLALAVGTERTMALSTPMRDGSNAATSISRWEASATYTVATLGALQLAPRFGGGRRAFTIESADSSRSPDSEYNYLIAGVDASAQLGSRITLRAAAAFEPVLFGAEPTEMELGEASRWALELGAAVEVRASQHLFVRAAAGYQRFHWSWDMAGDRGAGGAVDSYPSGALSVGATY